MNWNNLFYIAANYGLAPARDSRRMLMPHISVVIPVYKAENCLNELFHRLRVSLEKINNDFEIILIEDCGGDRSWEIIESLANKDPRVKGIQFSRNFGQHYGITAGLDHVAGDWVVVMDCDLQDRPEDIQRMYEKVLEGFDVVVAARNNRKGPLLKRLTSWAFYKVFNYFANIPHDGRVGNFRIMSARVVENFRLMGENLRFFGGLVDWMGFPTCTIEVLYGERLEGKSTYTFKKLLKLAVEIIIAYSDKPLRLSIKVGFLLSFLSFFYGGYIMVRALLYGSPVMGWSSLIVSIFFIGGIIIANLGIIGIYLGKTFNETKKRPLYIVKERINV